MANYNHQHHHAEEQQPHAYGRPSTDVDAHLFQLVSSSALRGLLDKIVGSKTLILEPSLAGPLGLITQVSSLKNGHGVSRMFWLEPGALGGAASGASGGGGGGGGIERNIVYLCRPQLRWIKIIADQIKATSSSNSSSYSYHLLVVPRLTAPCQALLSDLGVLGSLDIHEFQLGLITLESDLLSLEMEDSYKRLELDQDGAVIWDMAKGLMVLQRALGEVPRIIGKGEAANVSRIVHRAWSRFHQPDDVLTLWNQKLVDLLQRLRREASSSTAGAPPLAATNASIDSMVILDRSVDLITPMCTQLTYEGLIDEVIGIKNSHVDVDPSLLNPAPASGPSTSPSQPSISQAAPPKPKKHLLSSTSDPLFPTLRDANFAIIGSHLNRIARRLNDDYDKRHQARTPAELRLFVGQLGGLQNEHQSLRLHTALTEKIMTVTGGDEFNTCLEVQQNTIAGADLATQEATIRELINQEVPLYTVLRLLCLYSLVSGGLKQKVLEEFKKEILQTYGYQHLTLLTHLTSLSILSRPPASLSNPSKSPFALSRKPLKLIVDDVDESSPSDISYVFSGYAPLSVRLVQCAIGAGGAAKLSTGSSALAGLTNGASSLGRMSGVGGGSATATANAGNGGVNGWKGVEEVVKTLRGGEIFDRVMGEAKGKAYGENEGEAEAATMMRTKTTVVVYLGGITYAEVAALRFAQRGMRGRNLLIVTTEMIQGTQLLKSLQPGPLSS
ncbi:BZ3500_MvSof-1268-A1-R1_Chr3-1g06103 [Microbotryum saponariae]|uniref:BZ3500_MvSof-1268-A1-R1_Chr3-1g06103 protein n=1 Tax=Microbotryum saponariae TaxID=289078 RepID=A0A2X0NEY5_9BASI|nr:BZ3500_MvSof-1268-A1-R1_Chr3-1g06103 [Microbotryum saponariae]SDA03966.1 BZ3501_MvSof-1269-A2-R1_Chr3-2g05788 [Microbotryum saponariae]